MGREIGGPAVQDLQGPLETLLVPDDLVPREKRQSDDEGDEVVDQPEGQERPQDVRCLEFGGKEHHDDGFQDSQAPRHLTGESHELRQEIDRQEGGKRHRGMGQQEEQSRAGTSPVQAAGRHLAQGYSQGGGGEGPFPNPDGFFDKNAHEQVKGDYGHAENPDGEDRLERQVDGGGQVGRLQEEEGRSHGHEPDPEGHSANQQDVGGFPHGQAPSGIKPVAYAAPGDQGSADVVAEGIGDEGSQGGPGVGKLVPDELKAQEIVKGQCQVASCGGEEGQEEAPVGDLPEVLENVLVVAGPNFPPQDPKGRVKEKKGQEDAQCLQDLGSVFATVPWDAYSKPTSFRDI